MKTFLTFLLADLFTAPLLAQPGKTQAQATARKYPPLPEIVERQQITIWSRPCAEGTKEQSPGFQPWDDSP